MISALNHLHNIFATSQKHSDAAVGAIASSLEALIYLQESDGAESIEQAQRAIALARRSQLDPAVGDSPKLVALTHFVDLCCTLRRFEPSQAMAKMQAMQATLEALREGSSLGDENSFYIPIDHTAGMDPRSRNGVIRSSSDGTQLLNFDWIPTQDIYSLGFLLSGICVAHKNTSDGQKSESMLHEGLRLQQSKFRLPDMVVTLTCSRTCRGSRGGAANHIRGRLTTVLPLALEGFHAFTPRFCPMHTNCLVTCRRAAAGSQGFDARPRLACSRRLEPERTVP